MANYQKKEWRRKILRLYKVRTQNFSLNLQIVNYCSGRILLSNGLNNNVLKTITWIKI